MRSSDARTSSSCRRNSAVSGVEGEGDEAERELLGGRLVIASARAWRTDFLPDGNRCASVAPRGGIIHYPPWPRWASLQTCLTHGNFQRGQSSRCVSVSSRRSAST